MSKQLLDYFKLDKPLIVFSLATTGLALSVDRIVRLSYTKYLLNSREISATTLINPEMSIPAEATTVHAITDEMVAGSPNFASQSKALWDIFNNCYYSGYNITRFDLPLLRREFIRSGLDLEYQAENIFDIKTIYSYLEPHTLKRAYKEYCSKDFEAEHNQDASVKASSEILLEQFKRYGLEIIQKVPGEVNWEDTDLSESKFYWQDGEPYFAFSRFKHQPVIAVAAKERKFLEWMLSADFSEKVKHTVSWVLRKNN